MRPAEADGRAYLRRGAALGAVRVRRVAAPLRHFGLLRSCGSMADVMVPVLSASDLDTNLPFFFVDGEEDFYPPPRCQLDPGPGEDIWEKFELLQTPPMSPRRTPPRSTLSEPLGAIADFLDEDCASSSAFLQSFIIQDCMWSSSLAAASRLEQAVSERLASLWARPEAGGAKVDTEYLKDLQASDCIDPSEVFPYGAASSEGAGSPLCLETPPPSSSDSESEEEVKEDEDEEEVDVVTVERRRTSRRTLLRCEASPLVLKRSHIDTQQHNYAAPRPAGKRPKAEAPPSKESRSDGEDGDRRRTHNVLERQRRSELRRSLAALREVLPALAANTKAAKVAILREAAAFLREVREDERRLLRRKEQLAKRSRELRRRLEKLRTSR